MVDTGFAWFRQRWGLCSRQRAFSSVILVNMTTEGRQDVQGGQRSNRESGKAKSRSSRRQKFRTRRQETQQTHREGRTQAEELGDKDQRSHRKNIQETLQNKKQQILTPPHRVSQPTACQSQAAKSKPFKTLRQKILIVLQKYLNKKMLKITLSRYWGVH